MRRAILTMSAALTVIACCALYAQSASAMVPQAFACIETKSESVFHYPSWENCWHGTARGSGKWERLLPAPGTPLPMTLVGSGTTLLAEGVEVKCELLKGEGSIETEGKIQVTSETLSGCKVAKPTGCKVIKTAGQTNGTVVIKELPTQLVELEGSFYDELRGVGKEKLIATLVVELSEGSGKACGVLPLKTTIEGTSLGVVNIAAQRLEFKGKSGEAQLKLGGLAAKFEASIELQLTGGGKVAVE
jgi:hypothetical protein